MRKETRRSAEMRRVLEEYANSGQKRREFCEQRRISLTTFDYWRRQHRVKLGMVRVKLASPPSLTTGFTLGLANGRRIECSWGFADAELTRLIRIAESA